MDIGAETDVIGQIKAHIVGIVVDNDVIVVPKPVAAIGIVVRRNLEEKTAYVKSIRGAAAQPPDVLSANAAAEASVFPGMIDVVVDIVASARMAYPAVIFRVDVGSFRMAFLVAIGGPLLFLWGRCVIVMWLACRRGMRRRRAVGWNVSISNTVFTAAVLGVTLRLLSVCLRLLSM